MTATSHFALHKVFFIVAPSFMLSSVTRFTFCFINKKSDIIIVNIYYNDYN